MSNGRLDEGLRIRIGHASAVFGQLCKVWKSKVSLKTKLRIYNAVVIPTLLYVSETWAITQTEEKKQDVFDNHFLRRISGIMWFHHVRHTEERKNWPNPSVSPAQEQKATMVWARLPNGSRTPS